MGVRTYDASQVVVTFGGVQLSGYADGTFLNINKPDENFTRTVGADGFVSRSKSNSRVHDITITLESTSPSNDYLSGVKTLDDVSGAGVLPLLIQDLSGSTLFFSEGAWINQTPDREFSKEVGEVAWLLHTGQVDEYLVGGNA